MRFEGTIKAVEIDGRIYFDVVDNRIGSLNRLLKDLKDEFPGVRVAVDVDVVVGGI
jgi:hypothetical protein